MASFVTDLWESIFTPGPTPSILKAANVSFAALQATLLGLLLATYSIHFAVLSVISACLWWSINWFAAELLIAQEMERQKQGVEEKDAAAGGGAGGSGGSAVAGDHLVADTARGIAEGKRHEGVGNSGEASDTETERVESAEGEGTGVSTRAGESRKRTGRNTRRTPNTMTTAAATATTATTAKGVTSSVSTEDEWERVSQSEKSD